ncbi:MAG: flagellar export protein FliJ, partial [Pseudomonadota bacterium]|nr:flagellar export protein FliJ [Pseudomonadota bacterium]
EAQLQSLNRYRVEYAERLQQAMRDGIDPATMYNYQQFLASLDAALSRARQALAAQQKRVQQSQQHWQQEQRKLSSYDTLASRRLLEEHRRQARHEQKVSDDMVTNRLARQQSDKPL